jgi:NADPH:quinone reductase-like Zn-dependent oxidoreductase
MAILWPVKAIVQDRYGPPEVLRIEDVEQPVPKDDEVLIRVRASTVSQTDTHIRGAHPWPWRLVAGWRRPRWQSLGVEFAGEVVAVGSAVREFRVSDEVFGSRWFNIHAEFICMPETATLADKPAALNFEEAAAIYDGASQALSTLRKAEAGPGRRLVIYGASGSLGSAAVQIAKHLGAEVTAVCGTDHVELVRSLGADEVIDYRREDFTKNGQTYDAIIDAVGKYAFRWGWRSIRPGGVFVATDVGPRPIEMLVGAVATRWIGSRRLTFASGRRSRDDARYLKELVDQGVYRPVIDRIYPMRQAAEAHRHVEGWHKTGNVVLSMDPGG